MQRHISATLAAMLLLIQATVSAQDWSLDPGALAAGGSDMLRRAPDRQIDALFQAVNAVMQNDDEAQAMCGLFDPDADRSIEGLNAVAARLGPASRTRLADAMADVVVAALQSPLQAYDAAAARQALKAAGVTAAMLHDGFVAGLASEGLDAESRTLRCRSLRWLLDGVASRSPGERAAITRLLLDEGLARIGP